MKASWLQGNMTSHNNVCLQITHKGWEVISQSKFIKISTTHLTESNNANQPIKEEYSILITICLLIHFKLQITITVRPILSGEKTLQNATCSMIIKTITLLSTKLASTIIIIVSFNPNFKMHWNSPITT